MEPLRVKNFVVKEGHETIEATEGKEAINHKESGKKLTSFFSEILPDYDEDRVYTSNIKKVIQWYNILVSSGVDFSVVEASEENSEKA